MTPFELSIEQDTCHIVAKCPKFTGTEASEFKSLCRKTIETTPKLRRVVVDLANTSFLDSSGLGALIIAQKIFQQYKFELVIRNAGAAVMDVFSITGLDECFKLENAQQRQQSIPEFGSYLNYLG